MPRAPVPYPFDFSQQAATVLVPKTAMITAPATRWQDDPKFTYVSAEPYAGWFQPSSCSAPTCIAWYDGFTFGASDPVQRIEWQLTPADFPGLAPNKIVRINGILDWYRYIYAVDPVHRVLVKCNGAESFNPPEGWLGWGGGGATAFNMVVACDGSGNLNFEAGLYYMGGVSGSVSIGWTLQELEVVSVVVNPWDIIIDSAVVYHNGTTPISISRDGARFERRAEYEEYDFPGKVAPVYLGDQLLSERPAIVVKFMHVGEPPFLVYDPGATWSSGSFDRTLTPAALRTALTAGMYLSDVRCVWRLLTGGFLQVRFPKALCRSYDIGSADKNEGELPVMIEARQDLSAAVTPKTVPLYYIDKMPSTWAPVP